MVIDNAIDRTAVARTRQRDRKRALLVVSVVLLVVLSTGWSWFQREMRFSQLRVPLIKAVTDGDSAAVRTLLEQGADPDVRVDYTPEPFSWTSVFRMFGMRRAASASSAETVLMLASEENREPIVRLLLDHGARVDDPPGPPLPYNALPCAASFGANEALETLARYGAKVDARDDTGQTPLYGAIAADAHGHVCKVPNRTDEGTVDVLLRLGADVRMVDAEGMTPLMYAASQGKPTTLRLLAAHGAPLNVQDREGWTALIYAINRDDRASARALLEAGAAVNVRETNGRTALRLAVAKVLDGQQPSGTWEEVDLDLVRLLLEYHADPTVRDVNGQTVLDVLKVHPEIAVCHVLLNWMEGQSGLSPLRWQEKGRPGANTQRKKSRGKAGVRNGNAG